MDATNILATPFPPRAVNLAANALEACNYTTVALAAFAEACERMGATAEAACIRAFLPTLAAVELVSL